MKHIILANADYGYKTTLLNAYFSQSSAAIDLREMLVLIQASSVDPF